ncbi:MAG TPA: DR2241 family protein [Longimicrobium sp.]|uniref:DR2241 family protein n=1 Tax=Longimicrobium sp. TaxID=2029185 RepID=UPI002EDAD5CF
MSDAREERGSHAPGGVAEARAALLAWVDEAGDAGREFLEARIRAVGEGRYEIRHCRDEFRSLEAVAMVSPDPFAAREIAQTTFAGEHRPLKTAPSLRQGWALVDLDGRGVWTALDYLYPACALHWYAGRQGTLRVTHWREVAARQTGMYGAVKLLPPEVVRNTVRACCGDAVCLRRVAWDVDADVPLDLASEGPVTGDAPVPCPEACSMFVSFARQVLVQERSPRYELTGLGRLGADEIAQVREIVASAATGTVGLAREGEFSEPTNSRRMRYLALRLAEEKERIGDLAAPELPCEGCPKAVPCRGCPMAA